MSVILNKRQRDVVQAGEPDGGLRAAGQSVRTGAARPGRRALAGFAAGLAVKEMRWGRTAGNSGAANLHLPGAAGPLSVDRSAINSYMGAPGGLWGVRLDRLLRPASLGEKMAIQPFSP